ncbi:MAG: hypothetical protein AAF750_09790 [Planctomycetota bacterium]
MSTLRFATAPAILLFALATPAHAQVAIDSATRTLDTRAAVDGTVDDPAPDIEDALAGVINKSQTAMASGADSVTAFASYETELVASPTAFTFNGGLLAENTIDFGLDNDYDGEDLAPSSRSIVELVFTIATPAEIDLNGTRGTDLGGQPFSSVQLLQGIDVIFESEEDFPQPILTTPFSFVGSLNPGTYTFLARAESGADSPFEPETSRVNFRLNVTSIPEPATALTLALPALALLGRRRRSA